jgi:hypothetical protein
VRVKNTINLLVSVGQFNEIKHAQFGIWAGIKRYGLSIEILVTI